MPRPENTTQTTTPTGQEWSTSKSLEGTDSVEPGYSPDSPAPEQDSASIEASQNIVKDALDRITRSMPELTEQQLHKIGQEINDAMVAKVDADRDIYGLPENKYGSAFR